MNASRTTLFRFLFVALALLSSGAIRAGSFTLDPQSVSWPDSNDVLTDAPGPVGALPRLGVSSNTLGSCRATGSTPSRTVEILSTRWRSERST